MKNSKEEKTKQQLLNVKQNNKVAGALPVYIQNVLYSRGAYVGKLKIINRKMQVMIMNPGPGSTYFDDIVDKQIGYLPHYGSTSPRTSDNMTTE